MKPIFQISTDIGNQQQEPVLAIKTGEKHLGFAICSTTTNQLYNLSFYTAEDMDEAAVSGILRNHPELDQSFSRVIISYDHPQSVLIPFGQYKEKDAALMLQKMYGVNGSSAIMSEMVETWQLQNVFAVPKGVHRILAERFSPGSYQHAYSIGIRAVDLAQAKDSMTIDFRTDEFSLILISENKLLLAQTYLYANPADVIYTLLNACRQYSIAQEEVRLNLSGLIEKDSALYRDIYQYFLDVHFTTASWDAPAIEGQEYPSHFFSSLNQIALCVS